MWCLFVTHFLASFRNDQVETERRLTRSRGEVKAEASKGGDNGAERGRGGGGAGERGYKGDTSSLSEKNQIKPKDGNQSRIKVHTDHAVQLYGLVIRRRRRYCAQNYLGHGICF